MPKLARLSDNGALDRSWSGDGVAKLETLPGLSAVAFQPDGGGKLVADRTDGAEAWLQPDAFGLLERGLDGEHQPLDGAGAEDVQLGCHGRRAVPATHCSGFAPEIFTMRAHFAMSSCR